MRIERGTKQPWFCDFGTLGRLLEYYESHGDIGPAEFREITGQDMGGDRNAFFVRVTGELNGAGFQSGEQTDWDYELPGGYRLTFEGKVSTNYHIRMRKWVGKEDAPIQPKLL